MNCYPIQYGGIISEKIFLDGDTRKNVDHKKTAPVNEIDVEVV